MSKGSHADFIETLKTKGPPDLLYNIAEAHTGRHIYLLGTILREVVEMAEKALKELVARCNALD